MSIDECEQLCAASCLFASAAGVRTFLTSFSRFPLLVRHRPLRHEIKTHVIQRRRAFSSGQVRDIEQESNNSCFDRAVPFPDPSEFGFLALSSMQYIGIIWFVSVESEAISAANVEFSKDERREDRLGP